MKIKKLGIGLVLVLVIVLVTIYFHYDIQILIENFADWAYPNDNNRNGEIIKLIMNILAGIVITFGLYATFLRARATEKSVEKQEKSIINQTQQIKLSHKSQINEQFKNAIEHLGTDKEPIILGGISELHSIAKENREQFSDVVSNILTSYIRNEANVKKDAENINKTILQTIINYLLKTGVYSNKNINLVYCNFNGIDFNNISVVDSDFSYGILPWKLNNSNFLNCKFSKCEITLGRYENVIFEDCDFFKIKIRSGNFDKTIFRDNLSFQQIKCLDTEFTNCEFETNFYKSQFYGCEFKDCEFENSKFSFAEFIGSSFLNIKLPNNKIFKADFSGCGFDNVLSEGVLFDTNFNGMKSDSKYYSHFFEKQIEISSKQVANVSKFNNDFTKTDKCDFGKISDDKKLEILENYKTLSQN